tara:strand:+ start:417 stop:620 length:204 start_codon:yes stop_codon:yes gene_type:complete
MTDARQHYDRAKVLSLVSVLSKRMTMRELAARVGVDKRTLERYMSEDRAPGYAMQVVLSCIYKEECG